MSPQESSGPRAGQGQSLGWAGSVPTAHCLLGDHGQEAPISEPSIHQVRGMNESRLTHGTRCLITLLCPSKTSLINPARFLSESHRASNSWRNRAQGLVSPRYMEEETILNMDDPSRSF